MANVIKHKRGSGSDPAANNLVLGELAIRTDTGKLFTKMDSGAIAEIAGGGSDIVINTLSSSSGTGGGSATFNGSAYRFTLSAPPNVSAAQLLVSINGVIQKPVTGTGQPSEGFAVDGNDIILGDAPATGADFFILTFKSLGVSEPADNSVTSAKIVDGTIVNADINASAAIAGTKIAPDFGSQTVVTTGSVGIGEATPSFPSGSGIEVFHSANPRIKLSNTNTGTGATDGTQFYLSSDGTTIIDNKDSQAITFHSNASEKMRLDSSGNVGIGTASPARNLEVKGASGDPVHFKLEGDPSDYARVMFADGTDDNIGEIRYNFGSDFMSFTANAAERMRITSTGNVGIGTTSPVRNLHIKDTSPRIMLSNDTTGHASGDGTELMLDNGGNFEILQRENLNLEFFTSNTQRMTILGNGNCGIATTSPQKLLDVRGEFAISNSNASYWDFDRDDSDGSLKIKDTGTERMRIDSSGRLLIGTTTEGESGADDLTIENTSADMGITLRSATNNAGNIFFSDATSGNGEFAGFIQYQHNGNSLRFGANEAERMRIDSSGKVGIGTNSPQNPLTVAGNGDTAIDIVADLDNNGTNNWPILNFKRNSVSATPAARIYQKENDNAFVIDNNGSERMRILAGGGITFNGDTAAANALNDYEEGSWTPTLPSGGSGSLSGQYTKIGNKVFWALQISSLGGSAAFQVSGLPYAVADGWGGNISISDNNYSPEHIYVFAHNGQSTIYFRNDTNATFNTSTFSGKFFYCNGFYQVS